MKILPADNDYIVGGVKQTSGKNGALNLTWEIRGGNYYMILVCDARYALNLASVCKSIENEKTDVDFVNNSKVPAYTGESYKVYLISKKNMMANNHVYVLPNNDHSNNIPKKIQVFTCDYHSDEGLFVIYQCDESKENTTYIPGVINYSLTEHKKLFGDRYYELLVDGYKSNEYGNGIDEQCIVEYYVDGKVSYPVPVSCMGKKLYIVTPGHEDIQVRIAEKYKNQYKAHRNE